MNSYRPPFEITDTITMKVSSISEKIGYISGTTNIDSKIHLRKNNRIRSIHSSLKIEANSLSFHEVKDVINGKLVFGEKKEIQEVKNAYEAYNKLSSIDPFDMDNLLELHGIMTKYIEKESGQFRLGEEGVFDGDVCIFYAPPAKFVYDLMKQLFEWMNGVKDSLHPLILACVFHYEFVFIHPFSDGNGRMARLWHTAILSKWKSIFEYIPIESQIERFQSEYYKAIADCHKEGKSTLFIEFMLEQIDNILDEFIETSIHAEVISEYVKKLLDVMEYDVPYTRKVLMEKLDIKSRSSFIENYLSPALDLNLIRMSIPDKPNSRNQRYIKN